MAVQAQFISIPVLQQQQDNCFGFDFDFDFGESQNLNLCYPQQQQLITTPNYFEKQCCNRGTEASSSNSPSSCSSSLLTFDANFHPLDAQLLQMQSQELDSFLQSQTERLKCGLQEQTRQQMGFLLKRAESEAIYLMKQKEEHLTQAKNRSTELESTIIKTQKECESWQALAKQNESMAINLSKKLQNLISTTENCHDSESICCGSNEEEDEDDKCSKKMVCKGCNCRASSLVLLPCRHLCTCKFCEAFFISCPVCQSFKEGAIEVFLV